MRVLVLALFVALVTICSACGERAVGDSPCAQVCVDLRDKLIHTFGVAPEQIDCLAAKWSKARTCDDCKRVFSESYGVHVTGDEICAGF